jgi:hypothetical protein
MLIPRLFRRRQHGGAELPLGPEFTVRVTLRRGDKIVRRTAGGGIEIMEITAERGERIEIARVLDGLRRDRH